MSTLADRLHTERIVCVDDFLDPAARRRLESELRFTLWRPSTVTNRGPDGQLVAFTSRRRASESAGYAFFGKELRSLVGSVQERVCADFGLDADKLEEWQAIRYSAGGRFDEHHDAGLFGDEPGGERVVTVLLYVAAPPSGGAIRFPALGTTYQCRPGRLLVWLNLLEDGSVDPQREPTDADRHPAAVQDRRRPGRRPAPRRHTSEPAASGTHELRERPHAHRADARDPRCRAGSGSVARAAGRRAARWSLTASTTPEGWSR